MISANRLLHAPILLVKDGVEASSGTGLIVANIDACCGIADIVKTTLGPRGMDKLIHEGHSVTITNDGATVMDLLNVVHPAGKVMTDIAKSQDNEVGDGTTSVVVFAGELLREAKTLISDGMHPQVIIGGYRQASELVREKLAELKVDLSAKSPAEKREMITRCAETSLNSKLLAAEKKFFGKLVYDAVSFLDQSVLDKNLIGIKKVSGGSVTDSFLVAGVAFKKTFSYAGFEQQPKKFINPTVLLLNVELELRAERENAEIRISDPSQYQSIVDAEWKIIYTKLEKIVSSGASIVLSRLPIGDLATQYFADRNVFCAGRVDGGDMRRTASATGAAILSTVSDINPRSLGKCGEFEEVQIGNERYNLFKQCPETKSATIILRGGAEQFISEAERSLNDAIMIARRASKNQFVVGGGGAIEMELSAYLRGVAMTIAGKDQVAIGAFARALEVIPKTLAANSGLDPTDELNHLRQVHARRTAETQWMGVNCTEYDEDARGNHLIDTFANFIWEPAVVKENTIASATEAACLVLSIDEMVKNPKNNPEPQSLPGAAGRGRGARMM